MQSLRQIIDAFPKRVIVDTNVLLTAAFLPGHTADLALRKLKEESFSLYLSQETLDEARDRLWEICHTVRVRYNPWEWLCRYVIDEAIVTASRGPRSSVSGVNKADQHVAGLALRLDAWVITGDVRLAVQCQQAGIGAQLPLNVLKYISIVRGERPDYGQLFRIGGLSRDEGFLYAVVDSHWYSNSREDSSIHVALEATSIGRVEYQARFRRWAFVTQMGANVYLPCDLSRSAHWRVCASYRFPRGGVKGSATLRCAPEHYSRSLALHNTTIMLPHRSEFASPGELYFGHNGRGGDHWNGHYSDVCVGPNALSAETWKAVLQLPHGVPDPAYQNVLGAALRMGEERAGRIHVPAIGDLFHDWV